MILSHPLGNSFSRRVLELLIEKRELSKFYTTINTPKFLPSYLPNNIGKQLQRRQFNVPSNLVTSRPWLEMGRLALRKYPYFTANEVGIFCTDNVFQDFDQFVAKHLRNEFAVYAYEDTALHTFRRAKQIGMKRIYDLPIAHYSVGLKAFQQRKDCYPEFAMALDALHTSKEKLERKDEELKLAQHIICCSPFVTQSLVNVGIPLEKISTVQFGGPTHIVPKNYQVHPKLRVLFVGQIGERKGFGTILKAIQGLPVEFTAIGSMVHGAKEAYKTYTFNHIPSMPQQELWEEMKRHDLFVFPSILEGQAQVIIEAMCCGLPIITTNSSGASPLICDNGYLIPENNHLALQQTIEHYLQNPQLLEEHGKNSFLISRNLTWDNYKNQIWNAIASH